MSAEPTPPSEIILYQTEDGGTRVQVRLEGETVWLSLNQLADLFQRDKSVVSRHIKNLFDDGELSRTATVAKSATVQTEGEKQVTRDIEFYNLDVIISVGYRVKSLRGTQFRIWATQRLREYIVKGFTMDDERLKQSGGGAYFDELLERIRDIRSSEKAFWRKVLENLIVSLYLDFAELQARSRRVMTMGDWIAKLDDFMRISDREILTHAGHVTHETALARAEAEFEKFRRLEDAKPSPVEQHFLEAIKQVKQLEKCQRPKKNKP